MPTYEHLEEYMEGTERRTIRIPKSKAAKPNVSGHPNSPDQTQSDNTDGPDNSDPPRQEFSSDDNGRTVAACRACTLLAFVLSMCGALLFLIGFSCANWSTTDVTYIITGDAINGTATTTRGLWRTCLRNDSIPINSCYSPQYQSWQKGSQSMETIALILILAVLALCVYRIIYGRPGNAIPHIVLNLAAAFFMLVGVVVWGVYAPGRSGFCVYLVSVALLLFILAAIATIVEYCRSRHVTEETQPLGAGAAPSHTSPPAINEQTPPE